MHIKTVLCSAILFILLFGSVSALPNLKVNWVQYSVEAERIVAEVLNDSDEAVSDVKVEFYVDGWRAGLGSTGGERALELPPNGVMQVYLDFPYDRKSHDFYAAADPGNAFEESDEQDNASAGRILGEQDAQVIGGAGGTAVSSLPSVLILVGAAFVLAVAVLFIIVKKVRQKYE